MLRGNVNWICETILWYENVYVNLVNIFAKILFTSKQNENLFL